MTTDQIALIGLFFIVAVLLWVLEREHVTLASLIPSDVVRGVVREAVGAALDAADTAAKSTSTLADDELVKLIRQEAAKIVGDALNNTGGAKG